MKTLYFDCFAGASGNMILAALVALGVKKKQLTENIKLLNIPNFEIEFSIKDKSGISAVYAEVKIAKEKNHRHLPQIEKIIGESGLSEKVKNLSIEIFRNLAQAEANVHGIEPEKVHFHEVGAMDAIIDVVGACIGFELLEIEKFVCSKIHVGSGFVQMAHGKFPVPPPAVAEILQTKNAPIYSTEIEGELITPTGAAIIATVCQEFGKIPEMKIEKSAYGAGTRDYQDFPNVLRLILGTQSENEPKTKNLILIETNIDDISPEILGFVMERAFEIGALDCWFTPIQMKKNRPATMISILGNEEIKENLIELLYTETSTLGIRVATVERDCLKREVRTVETEFGAVNVKIAKYKGKTVNAKPEYDQIREIAVKSKIPIRKIEKRILDILDTEKIG